MYYNILLGLHETLLGPVISKKLSSTDPVTVFIPTTEAFFNVAFQDQNLVYNDTALNGELTVSISNFYIIKDRQLLIT